MDLSIRMTPKQLKTFVGFINELSDGIGFKISSRGWGYILEQRGLINKDQFDKVEGVINRCRREGLLPVDFVAEEAARAFSNIEIPHEGHACTHVRVGRGRPLLRGLLHAGLVGGREVLHPDGRREDRPRDPLRAGLRAVSHPHRQRKGWSSILQRAEYCRRFAAAERGGCAASCSTAATTTRTGCGSRRRSARTSRTCRGSGGRTATTGTTPSRLRSSVRPRARLHLKNKLTWIDNLITGSGKDLGSPSHPNYGLPYLTRYLQTVGRRKCEANSIVIVPEMGRRLCEQAVLGFLGTDAEERFSAKTEAVRAEIEAVLDRTGAGKLVQRAVKALAKADR
jgi:hypothetical protein